METIKLPQPAVDQELNSMNPFKVLRESARTSKGKEITQADLAVLSGVTVQYIGRQELGLINVPSLTVSAVLIGLNYSTEFSLDNVILSGVADLQIYTGVPFTAIGRAVGINDWYDYWVEVKRTQLARALSGVDFSGSLNVAQLISAVTSHIEQPDTVYEFCKLLAIHPYTVQSVLTDATAKGILQTALTDSGITWGVSHAAA